MTLTDLPQSILFLIFLMLFLLLGIYPAWQRTAAIIRKFLAAGNKSATIDSNFPVAEPAEFSTEQQPGPQLNTLESIVFQRLVMSNGKSLSRKQINADLHLEPALLKTTLDALLHRGLLRITMTALPIIRFQLTEKGHDYALEQGCMFRTRGE